MIRFPIRALFLGMDMLIQTLQNLQGITNQSLNTMADDIVETFVDVESGKRAYMKDTLNPSDDDEDHQAANLFQFLNKEKAIMADHDLGGEDLKLVRYYILFTRRDLETTLADGTEVVEYSTSLGDYQGAKKAEYIRAISRAPYAERPQKWKKAGYEYPPERYRVDADGNQDNNGDYFTGFDDDDLEQFVKVFVEVLQRYPKDEAEYEKDQAQALRGIRDILNTRLQGSP